MKRGQGQKIALASAATLIFEPVSQMMHLGGPGVIVSLAAGIAMYLAADDFQQSRQQAEEDDSSSAASVKIQQKPGLNLAQRLLLGRSMRGNETSKQEQSVTPSGLPQRSVPFAKMKHLIQPGRDILGFDGQKFISGVSFSQVVNIAIIGMPRHGKTTCLRFHVAQGLMHEAIIRGWDIQGDIAGEFGDVLSIAETREDILADCEWVHQEIERRAALYKRCRRHDQQAQQEWVELPEILYVIDEFLLLMTVHLKAKAERETVTNALIELIAGSSKYKVRVILSGQALPANLFGDTGSATKDIISAKYALASEDRQARMIGIDEKAIKELLPRIAGEKIYGYAVLAGGPLAVNTILSVPDTTYQDIRDLLGELANDDQDDQDELAPGITAFDLEQIAEAYNAGWSIQDTIALVQMDLRTFKMACELLGINIARTVPEPRQNQPEPETVAKPPVVLMPKPASGQPKATYPDAVKVWNELGEIGRPRLQKELQNRGLECSDDLAKTLLAQIKATLEKQSGGAGGAGANDGETARVSL